MKRASSKQLVFLVYALAVLMLCICISVKLLQHYSFGTNDSDTGIYANVAWNIANGNGFYSSSSQHSHLGEHFSPITAVFAPFMRMHPTAYWLMFAQGLAVGVFFIVLVRLCFVIGGKEQQRASAVIALCILLLSFMYTPLVSALCFEFHPSTLAMPLIALAILAVHENKNVLLCLLLVALLTTKESAILAFIGLGLYAWLVCKRRRLALALFALGGIAAIIIFKVIIPYFRIEEWGHYSRLGLFDHWTEKSRYLLLLVLPLGFLPLLHWRALAAALPAIALNLSVAYKPQFSSNYHYDDMASVFLLIAATHGAHRGASWIRNMDTSRKALIIIALLLFALCNKGHSPLWSSPLKFIPRFWPTAATEQLRTELAQTMKLVSPDAGVAAQESLGTRLCMRYRYTLLADQLALEKWLRPGDWVFITPMRQHVAIDDLAAYRKRILSIPGITPTHVSDVLEVYKVAKK